MKKLTLDTLTEACRAGGSSVLTSVTQLEPAGGHMSAVAPARFVSAQRGGGSTYSYIKRYDDGVAKHAVVIDSKQSQLNRCEAELAYAIADGEEPLVRTPRVNLSYDDLVLSDIELPHRIFDGHLRAGTIDGVPTTQHPQYRAARDATKANARSLLELSPGSLVFGSWDSSRATNQGRYQSALVGEIIGILADQTGIESEDPPMKGGARVDPVGMSVQLSGKQMNALAEAQADELSPKLLEKLKKDARGAKSGTVSGSSLGLGGVPPTLGTMGGVACSKIVRSHVLSFAALRQLRFDAGTEGDAGCRALLAAYALNALARSDAELNLRADCHLVESGEPEVTLDLRRGRTESLCPLTIAEADDLLAAAIEQAETKAGITWNGVVLEVTGNPEIRRGAVDEDEE